MGFSGEISQVLEVAIETRAEDEKVINFVKVLNHQESWLRAMCERFISDLEGERFLEGYEEGSPQKAEEVGKRLAQRLLREGGEEIPKVKRL
jgi:hydroxymethylbilane synthase